LLSLLQVDPIQRNSPVSSPLRPFEPFIPSPGRQKDGPRRKTSWKRELSFSPRTGWVSAISGKRNKSPPSSEDHGFSQSATRLWAPGKLARYSFSRASTVMPSFQKISFPLGKWMRTRLPPSLREDGVLSRFIVLPVPR